MTRWLVIVLVACSAPPKPLPPPPLPKPQPVSVRTFRKLHTGHGRAKSTAFTLTIADARAELVEIRSAADDGEHWRELSTRRYAGTTHADGAATVLELATEGQQPLQLRCTAKTLAVAPAGAHRVGTEPCTWEPVATEQVAAFICGEASQADDGDDDDRLVFADPPGIEYAVDSDACPTGGLRRASR